MEQLTPETFLQSKGIDIKKTTFTTIIEDALRSPDLVVLFHEYAHEKLNEYINFQKEKQC